MAYVGKKVKNKVTGESYVILELTPDVFKMDFCMLSGGYVAGTHVHPTMDETFTIKEGSLIFHIEGQETVLKELNKETTVKAGQRHVWNNSSDTVRARAVVVFQRMSGGDDLTTQLANWFEIYFGLCDDGKCTKKGVPHYLQLAILIRKYKQVFGPPYRWENLLACVLAPIGRLFGYKSSFPEYTTTSGPTFKGCFHDEQGDQNTN